MKYVCLVYVDPAKVAALSQAELEALDEESVANDEELRRSGQLILAQALEPVSTATTVRMRNGRLSASDGPFAETNEQLGGFMYVEARDLNEAIAIAGRAPVTKIASIEVRPVTDLAGRVRERAAARQPRAAGR
jgi:hypothetical protein